MRTCVWCDDPLPESPYRGHRRREFCKPPKTCKQQHYLWHKKMRNDANALAEPFWRTAYGVLVEQYKSLERLLQKRIIDLGEYEKRTDRLEGIVQYYENQLKALQIDYTARLKTLGMNEQDIEEFHAYWEKRLKPFYDEEENNATSEELLRTKPE
jgi:hypothetical protein